MQAEVLKTEAKEWDAKSADQLLLHHRWAQATTAPQIAIALSAIALLTRRHWLLWAVYGGSTLGLAIGTAAAAHI